MPGSKRQNSMFGPSTGYIQKNNPFPVTSCGRRRSPIQAKNVAGKEQGVDGKACWKGYRYAGTEGGKDKCVKI